MQNKEEKVLVSFVTSKPALVDASLAKDRSTGSPGQSIGPGFECFVCVCHKWPPLSHTVLVAR